MRETIVMFTNNTQPQAHATEDSTIQIPPPTLVCVCAYALRVHVRVYNLFKVKLLDFYFTLT